MSRWELATKVGYNFLKIKTLLLENFILKLHDIIINKIGKRGAIALELALSIPVFMGLLYYMHDIPKMNTYKTRMKFAAMCAANMFQNISSNRANKSITLKDYAYISSAVEFIRVGGGVGHYYFSPSRDVPYLLNQCVLYYVKGLGNNQAKVVWALRHAQGNFNPTERHVAVNIYQNGSVTDKWCSISIKTNQAVNQSSIHKDLNLAANEVVIIVDVNLTPIWTQMGYYNNTKKDFKLLVVSPKAPDQAKEWVRFPAFVIFSPKPGLFSETPPR